MPLPLSPDTWRRLLRRVGLPDGQLAVAIVSDRRSALLYRGLAALDEPTLAALAAEPDALWQLHRRLADVMAAFGARFRVREGTVTVPGGEEAEPLWGALVGESPRAPAAFLLALLGANGGRRALLYDSVARLDAPRQRFALGLPRTGGGAADDSLRLLAAAFDRESAWWHPEGGAFARPEVDAARVLREVRLGSDGALAPPAARAFWGAVFEEGGDARSAEWAAQVRASPPAGAAWLAERIGTGAASSRRLRLEQLTFAQRVFGEAGESALPDVRAAVRGLRDARSVLLALERMGSRDPALFAAAAETARRAAAAPREEAAAVHGGLQGALSLIDRARFARTLDLAASERLVRSLCDVPVAGPGHARALAEWIEGVLLPELARAVYGARPPGEPETTLLRAMAGHPVERREAIAPFEWEGLWYQADPGRAEFARLERVRARQGGASLTDTLRACRSATPKRREPCAAALGEALVSFAYAASPRGPRGPCPRRRGPFAAPRLRRGALVAARGGLGPRGAVARAGLAARPRAAPRAALAPRSRRRRPAGCAPRARLGAATGARGPRGARQPPRPDRRRPRCDLRRDRDRSFPRGGPARERRGRGRGVPRGRPRSLAGAGLRVASRPRTGCPGELLLARGAPPPRSSRRAAVRRVGRRRRSRGGPRPAHARPRPARRGVRAPAAAGARGGLRGPGASRGDSTCPSGGCRRSSSPESCRRSCRTSSTRPDRWRPTTGWASTPGCARRAATDSTTRWRRSSGAGPSCRRRRPGRHVEGRGLGARRARCRSPSSGRPRGPGPR